jgi:hypothetical protein
MPMIPIRERAKPEFWGGKKSPDANWFCVAEVDDERGEQRKITRTLAKALDSRLVSRPHPLLDD